jgi:hypothetical protein
VKPVSKRKPWLHRVEWFLVGALVLLATLAVVAGPGSTAAIPLGVALLVVALVCGFVFVRQDRIERRAR